MCSSGSSSKDFGHRTKVDELRRGGDVTIVAATQNFRSGGWHGNVPPKSDWSAVFYQQLAACLQPRLVVKYCRSSNGRKKRKKYNIILYTPRYEINTVRDFKSVRTIYRSNSTREICRHRLFFFNSYIILPAYTQYASCLREYFAVIRFEKVEYALQTIS